MTTDTLLTSLAELAQGRHLTPDLARASMETIMAGEATPAQMGAFLMGLRIKGETADEIAALAGVMREKALRVTTSRTPLIDTCGTGGDQSGSFNISTTVAFVVAGAGAAVAKHGNRSVSSRCGSADLLAALDVDIDMTAERASRCLDEVGIAFLFAPLYHEATKHVVGPRRELGMRTVFNVLGPLTNPAHAPHQLVGVFDPELTETLARVLGQLGSKRAAVVAGLDGLDEISLSGPTRVAELDSGQVTVREVKPEDFGLDPAPLDAIAGGTAEENAMITQEVLEGAKGPARRIVVLNAAAALWAAELAEDWKQGIELARQSIDSGAAHKKLQELVRFGGRS
ncbi:MAG: anthranilate phosphoribosyltransferase [Planctomycetota bacterium]